ncbi:hypothetical protein Q8A67_024178 [Cirrhinus molitorella]|uniref:Uncharacterized protein n=1 Tax=Cirrhinus molitorella TaxID=172907 RepID=A0AA88P3Q3_9TELE|nr:hypothetical protein Q8A67_024178 [Cirrhinus molitorella]
MVPTASATGAARLKVKRLSAMPMSIASLLTRVTVRLRRPHSLSSPTIVIASTRLPIMCTCLPARIDVGLAVIAQIAPTAALLPKGPLIDSRDGSEHGVDCLESRSIMAGNKVEFV